MEVFIPKPEYTEDVQSKHRQRVELINFQSARLNEAREDKRVTMSHAVEYGNFLEAPRKLAMLGNHIDEVTYKASIDPVIHLTDAEKT